MTAQYLTALNAGASVSEAASRLIRSGASMKALLDDLTDFNRTKLGLGIHVALAAVDLAALFADELEQLRGANPSQQIELKIIGHTRGVWDGLRLQQLLRNLVVNAIIHGAAGAPVHVVLTGDEAGVTIEVKNSGLTIKKPILDQIFDPLKRGAGRGNGDDSEVGPGARIVYRAGGCQSPWGRCDRAIRQARNHVRRAIATPQLKHRA
jgi:signal transduction histidine kinase